MLDTVRFRIDGNGWRDVPSGWKASFGKRLVRDLSKGSDQDDQNSTSAMFEHEETGLRIGGTLEAPTWLETSLPGVLYGSNGILLKESDCDRAMARVSDIATAAVRDVRLRDASRLDLVGQFAGDLRQWNSALRRVSHKQVRRPGLEFFDSGLVWPGKYLHARLYDKRLEQTGKPGEVVRLEFQTRSSLVPSGIVAAGRLNYGRAYGAYARFCRGFQPREVPCIKRLSELLAWCEKQGFSAGGITAAELYLMSISARQQRRLRAAIAEAKFRYFQIDWDELVPAAGVPEFVDFQEVA